MKKLEYINKVLTNFQTFKGKAKVYCFKPNKYEELVYNVVKQFANKNKDSQILIVVDNYNTRIKIKEYINSIDDIDYNIKILSSDYINEKYKYNYKLAITVNINSNYKVINKLCNECTFILCIFNEITKNDFNNNVDNRINKIVVDIPANTAVNDCFSLPVEEEHIPIELSDADKELYTKYTNYINESMTIFGNLDNITKCRNGDIEHNISASQFRYMLAKENGWDEKLDMSIGFNAMIDEVYNPNVLLEKANNIYNISNLRRNLISDNLNKLDVILDIVKNNIGKKILIISKRGEFATIIANTLNENNISCGEYHNDIPSRYIKNGSGEYITYKSGANKGKLKLFGAKAISSLFMNTFNEGDISILSIKESSSSELKIAVDLIIQTTPLYIDSIDIIRRFNNIEFNNIVKVFKLFCTNTIEHTKITKQKNYPNVKIIANDKEIVSYDENNGDIIL